MYDEVAADRIFFLGARKDFWGFLGMGMETMAYLWVLY